MFILAHPILSWETAGELSTSLAIFSAIANALTTFPTPKNVYGQWFLGVLKFIVGQRLSAINAIKGMDTVSVSVAQGTGKEIQQKTQSNITSNLDAVKITENKETVIPTGTSTGAGE